MNFDVSPDLGGRFQSFSLNAAATKQALTVSPYFLAYLQNKIAAYAGHMVDSKLPYNADPTAQVEAIIAHERLRNFVEAYEELLRELQDASQPDVDSSTPT